jgi:hypothetical protein
VILTADQFEQLKRDLFVHCDRRTLEYMVKVFAVALQLLKQHWPAEADRRIYEIIDQVGGAAIICLRDEWLNLQPTPFKQGIIQ